jgi:HEAT repeat protein
MNPAKPDAMPPDEKAAWDRYFDYLIKLLGDPDPNMRIQAAHLLGENRDPRAIGPLAELLADNDASVRVRAVEALGRIGPAAVEHLVKALGDPDTRVRQLTTKVLGQIGEARVVAPLLDALRDPRLSSQAAFALTKMGATAVEALVAALRDRDPNVRWHAARILGHIGDRRALPELERLAREDHAAITHSPMMEELGTRPVGTVAMSARKAVERISQKK